MKGLTQKIKSFIKGKWDTPFGLISIGFILFLLGWTGHIGYIKYKDTDHPFSSVRANSPSFKYINPLLFVDNSKENFPEYDPLEKDIEKYIDQAKRENKVKDVSVYFRDINTSGWLGVNKDELYAPSSMLKVVVLLAYLKLAEKDPSVVSKPIYYSFKDYYGENYKPLKKLNDGYHPTKEILQYMITDSDNSSMSTLVALNTDAIVNVYKDLKMPSILEGPDDFMSVEYFSYVFRALYNSSYLRQSYSEEALKLLTYTNFNKGIVDGVSSSTTVAHKFGEHTVTIDGKVTERQLHDCGIVYYPEKPYVVCIMTRGKEFADLEKVISDISNIIFTFTKNNK